MKVIISHTLEEQAEAFAVLSALRRLHPDGKVRKSDRHPPFKHIYLTTKRPENPCNSEEST